MFSTCSSETKSSINKPLSAAQFAKIEDDKIEKFAGALKKLIRLTDNIMSIHTTTFTSSQMMIFGLEMTKVYVRQMISPFLIRNTDNIISKTNVDIIFADFKTEDIAGDDLVFIDTLFSKWDELNNKQQEIVWESMNILLVNCHRS